ncbi:LysR family transcriptional regulator [Agrobacterium tumefaciens]|uniref:LysR family transcriptional regulator n=1 Tax=Agrobacterium tumefaciens TaxID=358 RepID=UPI00287E9BEB|nr:LysR family transcriptional regulator [Agrobacterium tumefaciens]MDS7595449.1 LysR family transcriptional regulator [Agrobacterium tumefaciens]
MELQHLRAYVTIASTGHLGKAAAQLNLTQSAVSKQLKALEEQAGVALFIRERDGMKITPRGTELLQTATHALAAVDEFARLLSPREKREVYRLTLGTIVDSDSIKLTALLQAMREQHPNIVISLSHGTSGDGLAGLRSKRLDACFSLERVEDDDLDARVLGEEAYVIAIPSALVSPSQHLKLGEIAELPWIGGMKGSSQKRMLTDLFERNELSYSVVAEADQEASIIQLARSGLGVCLIRERLVETYASEDGLWFWAGCDITAPISIVTRKEDKKRPEVAALYRTVSDIWR